MNGLVLLIVKIFQLYVGILFTFYPKRVSESLIQYLHSKDMPDNGTTQKNWTRQQEKEIKQQIPIFFIGGLICLYFAITDLFSLAKDYLSDLRGFNILHTR